MAKAKDKPLRLYLVKASENGPSYGDYDGIIVAAVDKREAEDVASEYTCLLAYSPTYTVIGTPARGVKRRQVLLASNVGA